MQCVEIPLGRGLTARIDADDEHLVSPHKWNARKGKKTYAQASIKKDGRWRNVLLHRLLLNAPAGFVVDHINGDSLDNRRVNLRLASARENARNRKCATRGRFIGVTQSGANWKAAVFPDGNAIHLGTFSTEEEAAEAYNQAARVVFGEFASRNDVPAIPGLLARVIQEKLNAIERLSYDVRALEGEIK